MRFESPTISRVEVEKRCSDNLDGRINLLQKSTAIVLVNIELNMSEENIDLGEGRGENDNNFVVKSASMIIPEPTARSAVRGY